MKKFIQFIKGNDMPAVTMEEIMNRSSYNTDGYVREIKETVGNAGLAYELKVYNAIKTAKVDGLYPGDKPAAGFSNVGSGDIEATYNGIPFNIEIKASPNDQMGGGSFQYNFSSKMFTPARAMDPEDLELLLAAAKEKIEDIDNYILAARKIEPQEFHRNINGIPLKISVAGREELKNNGLLAKINKNIKSTTSFIIKHYNKKNVFYINVGGAGLFYMGKNPLKLPIPELSGEIQIEMRLGFGGGKLFFPTQPERTPARSAGLRLQGRLKTKGKSKYNLDDPNDIKKLFGVK